MSHSRSSAAKSLSSLLRQSHSHASADSDSASPSPSSRSSSASEGESELSASLSRLVSSPPALVRRASNSQLFPPPQSQSQSNSQSSHSSSVPSFVPLRNSHVAEFYSSIDAAAREIQAKDATKTSPNTATIASAAAQALKSTQSHSHSPSFYDASVSQSSSGEKKKNLHVSFQSPNPTPSPTFPSDSASDSFSNSSLDSTRFPRRNSFSSTSHPASASNHVPDASISLPRRGSLDSTSSHSSLPPMPRRNSLGAGFTPSQLPHSTPYSSNPFNLTSHSLAPSHTTPAPSHSPIPDSPAVAQFLSRLSSLLQSPESLTKLNKSLEFTAKLTQNAEKQDYLSSSMEDAEEYNGDAKSRQSRASVNAFIASLEEENSQLQERVAELELELADKELALKQCQSQIGQLEAVNSAMQPSARRAVRPISAQQGNSNSSAVDDGFGPSDSDLLHEYESQLGVLQHENIELKSEIYRIRTEHSHRIHRFLVKQANYEREVKEIEAANAEKAAHSASSGKGKRKSIKSSSAAPAPASAPEHFRSLSLGTLKMLESSLKTLTVQYSTVLSECSELKKKERRYLNGIRLTNELLEKLSQSSSVLKRLKENYKSLQQENSEMKEELGRNAVEKRGLCKEIDMQRRELESVKEENVGLRALLMGNSGSGSSGNGGFDIMKRIQEELDRISKRKRDQWSQRGVQAFARLEKSLLQLDRGRLSEAAANAISAIETIRKEFEGVGVKLVDAERREIALMEVIRKMAEGSAAGNSNSSQR